MEAPASVNDSMPLDDLWSRIDGFLRARLRDDLYERWFEPLRPVSLDEGRLQIGAPDKFHRDFVEDNYRGWFEEFVPELTGDRLRITFAVDDAPRSGGRAPAAAQALPQPAARARLSELARSGCR